jgi:hypothetical protein
MGGDDSVDTLCAGQLCKGQQLASGFPHSHVQFKLYLLPDFNGFIRCDVMRLPLLDDVVQVMNVSQLYDFIGTLDEAPVGHLVRASVSWVHMALSSSFTGLPHRALGRGQGLLNRICAEA